MIPALGVAQFLVLTGALFAGAASLLIALAWPRLRPYLQRLDPAARARALSLLCAAPLGVGLLHAALCALPGAFGGALAAAGHCAMHAHEGHAHLCAVHPPVGAGPPLGWGLIALLLLVVVGPGARRALTAVRARRMLRQLLRAARFRPDLGAHEVDSARPLALATGIGDGVLLSTSLTTQLAPPMLEAVLAHERAHVARRDPRRRLLAALLAGFQWPWLRRRLLADLALATEQACDERAARAVGDRLRVAQAIVAVERLCGGSPPLGAAATGFLGGDLGARVEALLAPALSPPPRALEGGLVAATALAAAVSANAVHHATEHLLSLLGA